jgi:hypothetical protein
MGYLLDLVKSKVKDQDQKLDDGEDFIPAVEAALQRYSRHNPRTVVEDLDGADSHDLDPPAGWVEDFSALVSVEWPVGEIPMVWLDPAGYRLYQSPDGWKLRLFDETPATGDSVRVTYTAPRLESQIPQNDFDAVACLAAADCCERLANLYTQSSDPTIGADVVNYRSKGSEYASRAKRLRELYAAHIGVDEKGGPAASMSVAAPPRSGRTRLTH